MRARSKLLVYADTHSAFRCSLLRQNESPEAIVQAASWGNWRWTRPWEGGNYFGNTKVGSGAAADLIGLS